MVRENDLMDSHAVSHGGEQYDSVARDWDADTRANREKQEVIYPSIVHALRLQEDQKVLDLACGGGHLTDLLSNFATAVGIDKNEKMLQSARERYKDISFIQGDIYKLPFEDGSFDALSSSCAYHYAEDLGELQEMISESARVLKTGGRLAGVVTNPDAPVRKWVQGSVRSLEWVEGEIPYVSGSRITVGMHDPATGKKINSFEVRYYTKGEYEQAFRSAGLKFRWAPYPIVPNDLSKEAESNHLSFFVAEK